jgi:hypothetical protein
MGCRGPLYFAWGCFRDFCVRAIHVFFLSCAKTWMAGTTPGHDGFFTPRRSENDTP